MKKSETGRRGEEIAAGYLAANGYTVIEKNFRSGHLETDIICVKDGQTVFVEVKTRTPASRKYGRPSGAVDAKKRDNLIKCAEAYIRKKRAEGVDVPRPRIDVVEVFISGGSASVNHIRNAVIKESPD